LIVRQRQKSAVNLPVPAGLAHLDPQLRDYISQQIELANRDSGSPECLATLGLAYAANLLWSEALQCFSNYTRINPKEPLGHLYFAVATQEMGDPDEAVRLLGKVAERFSDCAPAFDRLGTARLRRGEFKGAADAFRRLIELAPREWRGYAGLGEAKLRQNEFSEASGFLEKARVIEPDSRMVHHLLGYAYRGLGRDAEAEWEMRLGLNSEQTPMPDPWGDAASRHVRLLPRQIELASELTVAGRTDEAVRILTEAIKYHADNLILLEHLFVAYREMNQPQKALQIAQRMVAVDDHSVKAHVLLADACLDLGLNDQALMHAERAVRWGPDLPQPYLVCADALFALGRNEQGLAARREAFRQDPQNLLIALDIGDALIQFFDNPSGAKEFYEKATRMDPTSSPAHLRFADTCIRLGEFDNARRSLETVRKLAPDTSGLERSEARLRELTSSPAQ
jgi:tetratricopeptide (TPR) repeat protein